MENKCHVKGLIFIFKARSLTTVVIKNRVDFRLLRPAGTKATAGLCSLGSAQTFLQAVDNEF